MEVRVGLHYGVCFGVLESLDLSYIEAAPLVLPLQTVDR